MLGDVLGVVERSAPVSRYSAQRVAHRLCIDANPGHAARAVPHPELDPDLGVRFDQAAPLQLGGGTIAGVGVGPRRDADG